MAREIYRSPSALMSALRTAVRLEITRKMLAASDDVARPTVARLYALDAWPQREREILSMFNLSFDGGQIPRRGRPWSVRSVFLGDALQFNAAALWWGDGGADNRDRALLSLLNILVRDEYPMPEVDIRNGVTVEEVIQAEADVIRRSRRT